MSNKKNVVVKKVQPYPILAKFERDGDVFYGNIVKLTLLGFLVELNDTFVSVARSYDCSFNFPVVDEEIAEQVKVIKTYDQFRPPSQPPVTPDGQPASISVAVRLAEFHFRGVAFENKEKIKKFLIAIGQVPR